MVMRPMNVTKKKQQPSRVGGILFVFLFLFIFFFLTRAEKNYLYYRFELSSI